MSIRCKICDCKIRRMRDLGTIEGPLCYDCHHQRLLCCCGTFLAPTSFYRHLNNSKKHYKLLIESN
jgi:hypothetical protein